MRRTTQLAAKLNKEELLNKAQERFNTWIRMYGDANVTAEQMYEDMSCSVFSGDANYDKIANDKPILDLDLCFSYKGYKFELTSCNYITNKKQMLGLTNENFNENFPHGVFADRYVCWMYGNKDSDGHTIEEADELGELEYWAPGIYLVPAAWSWGTESDLIPYAEVNPVLLRMIDKFLETFKE